MVITWINVDNIYSRTRFDDNRNDGFEGNANKKPN